MYILGIESSCDETAASVLQMDQNNGIRKILSSFISSSVEIHALYGGVVPEIASRAHAEAISSLVYKALREADLKIQEIDAIAVTAFPGLIGALLVGVNFAKSLAYAYNKPLIPVNHIMGHIAACYLCYPKLEPPFFSLVASGGHSSFINVEDYTKAQTVGRTRDDAIGECFDKVGRSIGLPYPGGEMMDKLAYIGDKNAVKFPSAAIRGETLDMSFSGLKTAVLNYINNCSQKGETVNVNDVAASFTRDVCESVMGKIELAYRKYHFKRFVFSGGVSANSHLRNAIVDFGKRHNVEIYMPEKQLCGDNGAMIASQGYYEFLAGNVAGIDLNASATCDL